jgi:hypothetical protein
VSGFHDVVSLFKKRRFPARRLPSQITKLRALHIGGYWRAENDTVRNMMLGLESAGAQVLEYNTDKHPEALDTEGHTYDRGTCGPVWLREEHLMGQITNFQPHIIVCNAGGLSFYPDVAERLRRRHYLLGIALSDPDVFESTTRHICTGFDLLLTNEKNLVRKYRELGANAAQLPFGTNEKHFHPMSPLEKYKTEVLIMGRAHPNRIGHVKAIIEKFDTMVYGEGWDDYGVTSLGFIYGDEAMYALNSAKLVPVFLHNPDGTSTFVKPSILDFPAAGALVITDYLPDVEQYLEYGREIIGFSSTGELISKIEYYLSHPDEAEAIRKAGHKRVIREHTWALVWHRILAMCS